MQYLPFVSAMLLRPRGLLKPSTSSECGVTVRVRRYQRCVFFIATFLLVTFVSVFSDRERLLLYPESVLGGAKSLTRNSTPDSLGIVSEKRAETLPAQNVKNTSYWKWRLVACAMVHNESAYLVEWIEFHRLQGVEHFVLYTYSSEDLPEYIPMLYELAGLNDLIDVIPARFFQQNVNQERNNYAQHREWSMADCNTRYGKDANWLLLSDVSQFIYSPTHDNLLIFIDDQKKLKILDSSNGENAFSAVQITNVNFGLSGSRPWFRTWLSPNSYTGSVDLFFQESHNATGVYPLVIDHETSLDRVAIPCNIGGSRCRAEVTLVQGDRCPLTARNINECIRPTRDYIWPDVSAIRADRHQWQQGERSSDGWQNAKYTSVVRDDGKRKYAARIRAAIAQLKPRAFVDVDRICREEAVKTGQQVMCPKSHPYPFGDDGVNFRRSCCMIDFDKDSLPLSPNSNSCWNNQVSTCPDPVGFERWAHRSCCLNQAGSVNQRELANNLKETMSVKEALAVLLFS